MHAVSGSLVYRRGAMSKQKRTSQLVPVERQLRHRGELPQLRGNRACALSKLNSKTKFGRVVYQGHAMSKQQSTCELVVMEVHFCHCGELPQLRRNSACIFEVEN